MKIAKASQDNSDNIHRIFNQFFEMDKKLIVKRIKSNHCYIAIENGVVLGAFMYIPDYSHEANYLEWIAVDKNHRRKGISRLLIDKFIEISRKETPKPQTLALSSTNIKNEISIKMHLDYGFKELGILKELHYGEEEIFYGFGLDE